MNNLSIRDVLKNKQYRPIRDKNYENTVRNNLL